MTIKTFSDGEALYAADLNGNFLDKSTIFNNEYGTGTIDGTLNAPIGTIIAWFQNLAGVPALPSGWALCDGNVGRPNLTADIFLRGVSGVTGGTGGANSHAHGGYYHYTGGHYYDYWNGTTSTNDSQPPFYTIVWIIKIGV